MKRFSMVFFGRKIGFTLTEILIVVVIVALLATLALPMLVKTIEKAKVGEAMSNLNLIRTGQKIYFLEHGYFSGTGTVDDPIDKLNIENPNTGSAYFTYTIETAAGVTTDFTTRAQRKNDAPSPYDTHYYDMKKDGVFDDSNGM